MRNTGFYVFLGTVLFLYGLTNTYIILRGTQALPRGPWRTAFLVLMIFLVTAYPLARLGNSLLPDALARALHVAGAYYLAVMVFSFFLILAIDLFRLLNLAVHVLPSGDAPAAQELKLAAFGAVAAISLTLTAAGAWNARHPVVKRLQVRLEKPSERPHRIRAVLLSDLHLGTLVDRPRLAFIVTRVNSLRPDLILLAGDVFDEDISALQEQDMAGELARLRAPLGVFAVPGNHEYYSGIGRAVSYLRQAGITVLRDSAVLVDSSFYVVGRDDRTVEQFGGRRKALPELLTDTDGRLPVILMDHQPFHLEEAQQAGVDLQVSGHTHHGQLVPFNWITAAVYEVSWGYLRKGRAHYYVSCGVGTWGPPVRIGSRPEIVQIDLRWGPQKRGEEATAKAKAAGQPARISPPENL